MAHKRVEKNGNNKKKSMYNIEDAFSLLFHSVNVGIAIFKAIDEGNDFMLVDINPTGLEISGLARDVLFALPLSERYSQLGKNDLLRVVQRVYATGEPECVPFIRIKKDGGKQWLEYCYSRLPDGNVVSICKDLTEQKKAEEEAREGEQRFYDLFNDISDAVFIHTLHKDGTIGGFVDVNDAACRRLEYTREELLKLSPSDIDAGKMVEERARAVTQIVNKGHATFSMVHVSKLGREIPVEISSHKVRFQESDYIVSIARDVSERLYYEEKNAALGKILDESSDENYIFDIKTLKIVFSNESARKNNGYTRDEMEKMTLLDIASEMEMKEFHDYTDALMQNTEKRHDFRHYFQRKDGSRYPVSVSLQKTRFEQRDVFFAIVRDISEQVIAEQLIRTSEEKYHEAFDNSPISLWEEDFSAVSVYLQQLRNEGVVDFQNYLVTNSKIVFKIVEMIKILDVNTASVALHKASSKQELIQGLDRTLTNESLEIFKEELIALWEGKCGFKKEGVVQTLTGERLDVIVKWNVVPGYEKNYERVMVSLTDITERKHAEMLLRESEKKFRELLDFAPDAFLLGDAHGEILHANNKALSLTGYAYEELVSNNISMLYSDTERQRVPLRYDLLNEGKTITTERILLKKDGLEIWVEMNSKQMPDGTYQSFIRDISERKKFEYELRTNEERLDSLVRILQNESGTTQEFLDYALNEVIAITESLIGYIYFYDEKTQQFELNSWSKEVMYECMITNPQTIYMLEKTGVWGDAVRTRAPVIINDFTMPNPHKKGYPEGHVHLSKFLTVPVFHMGKIVAVVGVANKKTDYTQTDVLQLTLLMEAVWKTVEQRRAEEALIRSEIRYKTVSRISSDFAYSCIHNDKGIYLVDWISDEFYRLTGYSVEELREHGCWLFTVDEDDFDEVFTVIHSLRHGESDTREFTLHAKDGRPIEVVNYVECVHDATSHDGMRLYGAVKDLTEKKASDRQAHELSLRHEAILKSVPDIIMEVDKNKKYTWANEAGIEFFGDYVVGKDASYYFVGEQDTYQTVSRLFNGDSSLFYVESWQRRKDGQKRLLAWWCNALKNENGEVVGAISTARDITERTQMEIELLESTERFKALHNASFGGIAIHDKGIILECNQGLADMTGYSVAELTGGMDGLTLVAPDYREMVMNKIVTGYEKPYEAVGLRKNGERFPMRLEARNIPYKGKNVRTVEFRDLTESKQAEEFLRKSEERYRSLMRNLEVGIVVHAPDTSIIMSNIRASELLGLTDDQLKGKAAVDPAWKFVNDDNGPLAVEEYPVTRIVNLKKQIKDQVLGIRQPGNNEIVWVIVNGFPVMDTSGNISEIVISFIDITERKHNEYALKKKAEELEHFNKLMVGREYKMIELKREINELYEKAGLPPPYNLSFAPQEDLLKEDGDE